MMGKSNRSGLSATALIIVLLLALTAMGVGYGLWAKTLTIEGAVHTGEVDARWSAASCLEFHTWPDLPTSEEDYGEAGGKDVGSWTTEIDPEDDQVLRFAIENGYPSYAVDCEVRFQVEGTIPVVVRGTRVLPGANLTGCTLTGEDPKTLACDQLTVVFEDSLGEQLHPGEEAASRLIVHVEQGAGQDVSYEFEVLVCMAQWNEEATEAGCFDAAP